MPEPGPGDWVTTTVVDAPTPFASTADLDIGDGVSDPETRHRLRRRDRTASVTNWRMWDVTLSPALALVFKGQLPVEATRYCIYGDEAERAGQSLTGPRRQLRGRRCFLGFNRVHGNHHHVIAQIVHAVVGYAAEPGFAEGLLLLPAGNPRLLWALNLTGTTLPQIEWLDAATPVDIDDLTYGSMLTGCDGPSPFCRSVFDRILQQRSAIVADGPTLIYVWRLDSAARPMRNEDALVAMLAGYGVVPMVMSELSLDQQVDLFRAARLVVGPHGAGLTNVAFCPEGAVMYELMPDHYVNPCMNQLAQMRGVHYFCDVHPAEPEPGMWRHSVPWSVDVDAVERRLIHILSRHQLAPWLNGRNETHLASL